MDTETVKKTSFGKALATVQGLTQEIYSVLFFEGNSIGAVPARPASGLVDSSIAQIEDMADKLRAILKEVQLLK